MVILSIVYFCQVFNIILKALRKTSKSCATCNFFVHFCQIIRLLLWNIDACKQSLSFWNRSVRKIVILVSLWLVRLFGHGNDLLLLKRGIGHNKKPFRERTQNGNWQLYGILQRKASTRQKWIQNSGKERDRILWEAQMTNLSNKYLRFFLMIIRNIAISISDKRVQIPLF